MSGSLTTTSFYDAKTFVAFYCISNALSATVRPGFSQTGITLSKTVAGTYTFTSPTRPSGSHYRVFVQGQAANSTATVFIYNVNVARSTSFTVWSKSTSNVLTDSNFYVYAMP